MRKLAPAFGGILLRLLKEFAAKVVVREPGSIVQPQHMTPEGFIAREIPGISPSQDREDENDSAAGIQRRAGALLCKLPQCRRDGRDDYRDDRDAGEVLEVIV